jgi:hypothetical protein
MFTFTLVSASRHQCSRARRERRKKEKWRKGGRKHEKKKTESEGERTVRKC